MENSTETPELTEEEQKRIKLQEARKRWNKNKKDKADAIKAKNKELEETHSQVKEEVNTLKESFILDRKAQEEERKQLAQKIKEEIQNEYEQKILDLKFEVEMLKKTKAKQRSIKRVEIYGEADDEVETHNQANTSQVHSRSYSKNPYSSTSNPFNRIY